MTDKPTAALLVNVVGVTLLMACQPSDADDKARIMENAARSLTFSTPYSVDGNRAYMLEKKKGGPLAQGLSGELPQGIRAKVAVIFGYSNNGPVCEKIAKQLVKDSATWEGYDPPDEYDCNAID